MQEDERSRPAGILVLPRWSGKAQWLATILGKVLQARADLNSHETC